MGWFTEEIRKEALEEGREEGREKFSFDLVSKGLLTSDVAAKELNLSPEEFAQRAKQAGYSIA